MISKVSVIVLLALFITSCKEVNVGLPPIISYKDIKATMNVSASRAKISNTNNARIGIFDLEKKFIKEGRVYYKVDDLDYSLKQTKKLLLSIGGYVESEIENIRQHQKIIDLTLKVPNKSFEVFLDSLTLITGEYESRSVNLRDVTDQYIDTKVRIDNKKKLELKYLDLLKKAEKITDLLVIEENLGKVREEIESAEKRFFKLQKEIDYSTVNVKLYKISPQFKDLYSNNYSVLDSIKRGWYGMIRAIYSIIASWPLVILIALVILFVRNYLRKRKLKNTNTV